MEQESQMGFHHLPEEADCSWEYWESQERSERVESTKGIQYHHPPHLGEVETSAMESQTVAKHLIQEID